MKHWWLIILTIAIASILLVGCTTGYTLQDIEDAYQEGYNTGFNAGLAQCEDKTEQIEPPAVDDNNGDGGSLLPEGYICWYEAKEHIGDRLTVCGIVVDSHWASGSNGKPTFLNIGEPYPDPDRFTVVIWIDNRSKFPPYPEEHYLGMTVCVEGLIESYEGTAQIEATSPNQIQEPDFPYCH